MTGTTPPVLIVPGWESSGPAHWQTLWERADPRRFRRVEQRDWDAPDPGDWVRALDAAIAAQPAPSKRDVIRRIAEKHAARNVRVSGSVARGEPWPASDVDPLIDAGPVTSPWFPGGLIAELEALPGRRVDVVTERGLMPELRPDVLREAVPV